MCVFHFCWVYNINVYCKALYSYIMCGSSIYFLLSIKNYPYRILLENYLNSIQNAKSLIEWENIWKQLKNWRVLGQQVWIKKAQIVCLTSYTLFLSKHSPKSYFCILRFWSSSYFVFEIELQFPEKIKQEKTAFSPCTLFGNNAVFSQLTASTVWLNNWLILRKTKRF